MNQIDWPGIDFQPLINAISGALEQAMTLQQKIEEAKAAAATEPEEAPPVVVTEPTPAPPAATVNYPLAWGKKVSATFRDRVWWIAREITKHQGSRFDPNWLMGCMAWESGRTFSAAVRNMAGSGATGLIQFMPSTCKELSEYRGVPLNTSILAAMSPEDQLTWVYHYFMLQIKRHGPITTIDDCYMAILWPSAVGKPASYPLFDRAKKPTTYRQNAGLDENKDGVVTKHEAAAHVRDTLAEGMKLAA